RSRPAPYERAGPSPGPALAFQTRINTRPRASTQPCTKKRQAATPIISLYLLIEPHTVRLDMTKFVFVTGGVVSSLGKGIASASLAAILESRGLKVTLIKLDPYLNVDPGTMSPFQHGEVFVTDDGAETDLDLG